MRARSRRVRRNVLLGLSSMAVVLGTYTTLRSGKPPMRLSLATAYPSLALLAASLVIGPWHVLRGRAYPVSTDLRRDVGIWAAILGVIHVVAGSQVHQRGRFWLYFVHPGGRLGGLSPRHDAFGLANYTGLGATLVLALLVCLSNDRSLRRLGIQRWKGLQRWNYAGFALVAAHGIVYQLIERRQPLLVAAHAAVVAGVVAVQVTGFRRRRAREVARSEARVHSLHHER
jgi:sulfoxide reductase heme-binding subunit YedZ